VPVWGGSTVVTCRTAVSVLLDFIERTMPPSLRGDVQAHFDRCPACVRFVETYRKTSALCRRALARELPPGVDQRLRRFLQEKTGRKLSTARESG
jgi:anti-sigma factor RsiW